MCNRIYVAGPYSEPDREANTIRAIRVGHELMDLGYFPLVPHLTHYMDAVRTRDYEEWMQLDFAWLLAADAILRIPGESKGADREVKLAREQGIPVFYTISALRLLMPSRREVIHA